MPPNHSDVFADVKKGTFASGDGSRQPTAKELELATIQGEEFYKIVSKYTG